MPGGGKVTGYQGNTPPPSQVVDLSLGTLRAADVFAVVHGGFDVAHCLYGACVFVGVGIGDAREDAVVKDAVLAEGSHIIKLEAGVGECIDVG